MDNDDGTPENTPSTDRRSVLSAVGALPLGLGAAGKSGARQIETGGEADTEQFQSQMTGGLSWRESFDLTDGTTTDDGDTAWEIEESDRHPDVGVDDSSLTLGETDGTAVWRSEAIDISAVEAVELTVTASGSGSLRGPPDRDPPAVVGETVPADPDSDGIYEDVDGDGTVDVDDARALLANFEDAAVVESAGAYDQNCNDRVDYADLLALASEGRGGSGGDCGRVGDELTISYLLDGEKTVLETTTDLPAEGRTVRATDRSGTQLRVEIRARTPDPQTAYHIDEVRVAQPAQDSSRATSVSQYGITWEFEDDRPVGQYANGDWWVQGPVTITTITPESRVVDGRVIDGTMLNPVGGTQGYDSYDSDMAYDPDLNVDPGATGESLTVEAGSVVSSISLDSPDDNGRPVLSDLAILTVVEEKPPEDAFRPGPYSEDTAARWTERDLEYGVLRSLPVLESAPDLDAVTESVDRFWNEQETSWTQRTVHAANSQPAYGRGIANTLGEALLSLHLDYPAADKRDLFVIMVQRGIDIYDRASVGGVWEDNCGHNPGRKMPMLFAGLALDDGDIIEMGRAERPRENFRFQEDRQTFYVSEADLNNPEHPTQYTEADLGMPEWGCQYTRDGGDSANRDWEASYRWIGSTFVPHALAAHVMDGAVEAWNHSPFFDYVDRYVRKGSPSDNETNGIQPFAQAFWDEYRDDEPAETTIVANQAPDGSRLTTRSDGPVHHTQDGTVHLFTWDEPGPGARAVLYDEDERTDWGAGPDVHVYDTLERPDADAGEKPSLDATYGEWARWKGSPELAPDGHSGAVSLRVQDQRSSQGFKALFEETTEVFLSYCVKIPEGKAMPGGDDPTDYPDASTWKMAWLFHDDTQAGEDVDICLPSWVSKPVIGGNNIDGVRASSDPVWWQWGEWMRISFWLESGQNPAEDDGRFRLQVVTEGEETHVVFDRERPVMKGGTPPYTWKQLNIPGWADATKEGASADNVEALYDDIYLATGDNANARLELTDDVSYGDSTRMQLCTVRSWDSNRVAAILQTGSLDAPKDAAIHLTTADEETVVSLEVS